MQDNHTQILIIGGHDVGKTHFGGQIYGRLQTRDNFYQITSAPENITIFKEVLDNLNEGKSSGHTNVAANEVLALELKGRDQRETTLSFPDYGGEQVDHIVSDRRVNKIWTEQLSKSDSWMLFIRPDKIHPVEDIVTRGIPDQEVLKKRKGSTEPLVLSPSAHFVELLQILNYSRQITARSKKRPRLMVALSCWDLVADGDREKLPAEVLRLKLPGLADFLESVWGIDHTVIGLSSTEKTLSDTKADADFVKKGPEHFGFFVNPVGETEKDLTLIIGLLSE